MRTTARAKRMARAKNPLDLEQSMFRASNAGRDWQLRLWIHTQTAILGWLTITAIVAYTALVTAGAIINGHLEWINEYCFWWWILSLCVLIVRLATKLYIPTTKEY